MTDSGCLSGHGEAWTAIKRCAMPWHGPTTYLTTRKSHCWNGVRCSQAVSTSKASVRSRDSQIPTTTSSSIWSARWCANHCWSSTDRPTEHDSRCSRRSASSQKSSWSHAVRQPKRATPMLAISPIVNPKSWHCGTVPDNARPTRGSTAELANLRTAFRWVADRGDLDDAAIIANLRGIPWLSGG